MNENQQVQEATQEKIDRVKSKGAKGTRTTKVGGEQLKAKLKSGEIAN